MRSKRTGLIAAAAIVVATGTASAALGIVGGTTVQRAPSWMGSLQVARGSHVCGGALVSSTWAVTAKHCLEADLAQVRFGSLDHSAGGELVRVRTAVTAPSGADVALLQLSTAVAGTPVTVASSSPGPGTAVTLYGWGQTTSSPGTSPASMFLKELQTQVDVDSACGWRGFDGAAELCIQSTRDQTACYGDSGGPAVVDGMLVGVTSRGSRTCGDANTVYEDLTPLRAWIQQVTGARSGAASGGQQGPTGTATPEPPAATSPPAMPPAPSVNGPSPAGTGVSGLHIRGSWRLRAAPVGRTVGIARNGEVVTVDCQATGPRVAIPGLGSSRIWDHIAGRGFVTDLAVVETPYQKPDPRIPTCTMFNARRH